MELCLTGQTLEPGCVGSESLIFHIPSLTSHSITGYHYLQAYTAPFLQEDMPPLPCWYQAWQSTCFGQGNVSGQPMFNFWAGTGQEPGQDVPCSLLSLGSAMAWVLSLPWDRATDPLGRVRICLCCCNSPGFRGCLWLRCNCLSWLTCSLCLNALAVSRVVAGIKWLSFMKYVEQWLAQDKHHRSVNPYSSFYL